MSDMRSPQADEDRAAEHDARGGASARAYHGILADLDEGRMVPGQRLIETELAVRFGIGRNSLREAMQRLATRGIVDLSRHRSAMIRTLDLAATLDVLEVAQLMLGLAARAAARGYDPARDRGAVRSVLAVLDASLESSDLAPFSRARRKFYRLLLDIGGQSEVERVFPTIGMPIIYAQYRSEALRRIRAADYRAILSAICARDGERAEAVAHGHVDRVRAVIQAMAAGSASAA